MIKMTPKAQIQLGETIFVVIFILIILIFGIVFFSGAEKDNLVHQQKKFADLSTVSLAQYASSLSELACSKHEVEELSCFDLSKLESFAQLMNDVSLISITREYYFTRLGNADIKIQVLYPVKKNITLYHNEFGLGNGTSFAFGKPVLKPVSIYDPLTRQTSFGVMQITKYFKQ
jgi:hypothetical protein